MRTAAELTLGREADAVPKARRFVGSSLAGEPAATVHAVELVVTELVTNAVLHGEPPVSVRLILLPTSVRVEVEDTGSDLPVVALHDLQSTTGRGLSLVAGLSSAWGVDPGRRGGKVVWSELPSETPGADPTAAAMSGAGRTGDGPSAALAPEISPEAALAARLQRHSEPLYTVRLSGVPTGLLLAAKAHMDSMVRELTLLQGSERARGADLPPALASLVDTVTGEFALARKEMKRQAVAAAGRGEPVTDLELRLPLSFAESGARYLAALDEADRFARSARLLTMAPPLSHRVFRHWYVGSVVEQLRALGSGHPPPPQVPLTEVLAEQIDEMEDSLQPPAAEQPGDSPAASPPDDHR